MTTKNDNASQSLSTMFYGSVTFNGPMFDIHDNGTVVIHGGSASKDGEREPPAMPEERGLDTECLARAIESVQSFFWAQSAWAVVYCVCRDHLGVTESMTDFERRVEMLPFKNRVVECPVGTVQRTISNNEYMKYSIHRWGELGAKSRAVMLARKLAEALG